MAALSMTPQQWGILAAAYVLLCLVPAVFMWRRARRDGDAPLTWALLVAFTSFLGFVEYRKHRSILAKRARRAAAAASSPGAGGKPGPAVTPGEGHQGQDPPPR